MMGGAERAGRRMPPRPPSCLHSRFARRQRNAASAEVKLDSGASESGLLNAPRSRGLKLNYSFKPQW